MMTIDVETLRRWLEEGRPVTILDVRPTAERAEWAIPGSLHVDAYDALKAHDPAALADVDVPSDGPVVTVCAAGKTSLIAAEQLAARGVEAMSLEGGMKAWSLAWNAAEAPIPASFVRVIQVGLAKAVFPTSLGQAKKLPSSMPLLTPRCILIWLRSTGGRLPAYWRPTFTPIISPDRTSSPNGMERCSCFPISSGSRSRSRPSMTASDSQQRRCN